MNEILSLNQEDVKNNIKAYSSKKLADIVILYRFFKMYKDLAMLAMQELSDRRLNKDLFNFEEYIEENLNSLSKINEDNSLLSKLKGFKLNVK